MQCCEIQTDFQKWTQHELQSSISSRWGECCIKEIIAAVVEPELEHSCAVINVEQLWHTICVETYITKCWSITHYGVQSKNEILWGVHNKRSLIITKQSSFSLERLYSLGWWIHWEKACRIILQKCYTIYSYESLQVQFRWLEDTRSIVCLQETTIQQRSMIIIPAIIGITNKYFSSCLLLGSWLSNAIDDSIQFKLQRWLTESIQCIS